MNANDAWTYGTFADTAQTMSATIPALPTLTPGTYPTLEHDIIAAQHIVAAATAAGLPATWHHDNPDQVGDPIHAAIRLPHGRLTSAFPRVNRDGQWWFELLHFTPEGMRDGDWDSRSAASADDAVNLIQEWKENPPA